MALRKGKTIKAKNPSGQLSIGGGAKKSTAMVRRGNTAVAKKTTAKRRSNPSTARRNPSIGGIGNFLLLSGVGVIAVKGFDAIVKYFVPQAAGTITAGAMAAGAIGMHFYGRKVLGGWADVAAAALGMFALYRLANVFIDPLIPAWAGGTAGVPQAAGPPQPLISIETGQQLGVAVPLDNGSVMQVYGSPQELAAFGYA